MPVLATLPATGSARRGSHLKEYTHVPIVRGARSPWWFWRLAAHPTAAEDKKDKEKFTVWTREINGIDLKFEMGKETAKYHVYSGDNGCIVTSKVKIEKGVVMSEVTDVEIKGNFPAAPEEG